MKRLSIGAFILFLAILVFFTFFGNAIYDRITPEVSAYLVGSSYRVDETIYLRVPREAVTGDDTVYEIVSEQAFFRMVYMLRETEVSYKEALFDWDDGDFIYVYQGLRPNIRLLRIPDDALADGARVRVKRLFDTIIWR